MMRTRLVIPLVVFAVTAALPAPPGSATPAEETFVTMIGDRDAGVVGGRTVFYRPDDSDIRIEAGPSTVWVEMSGGNLGLTYRLEVSAPQGETLRVGDYDHALGFPEPGRPGLDLQGEGRVCRGSESGRFRVERLDRNGDGTVASVWITFELRCHGDGSPAVLGEVRYRVPGDGGVALIGPRRVRWPESDPLQHDVEVVSVAVVNPSPVLLTMGEASIEGSSAQDFVVRLDECAGRTIGAGESCLVWVRHVPASPGPKTATLVIPETSGFAHAVSLEGFVFGGTTRFVLSSAPGDPIGDGGYYDYGPEDDARINVGGTTESVFASVESSGDRGFDLRLSAPAGEELQIGRTYSDATGIFDTREGHAVMDVGGDSVGCGDAAGEFTISELEPEVDDVVRFAVSFDYRCTGYPPLRGVLDYRAENPHAPPQPFAGRRARTISIALTRTSVTGQVRSGAQACVASVPVLIEKRRRDGTARVVARTSTDDAGTFGKSLRSVEGAYRTRTPRKSLGEGSTCAAARSSFRSL